MVNAGCDGLLNESGRSTTHLEKKTLARLALTLVGACALLFGGCTKQSEKKTEAAPAASAAASAAPEKSKELKIGFIYVGPRDDFGYNQSHAEAAKALASGSGVKILEEEKVAETMDAQRTMESMIQMDGATVLFPTSFGYFDPHILKVAEKYPDVTFLHCGGLYDGAKHPKNVGSYFGYIDEVQYLNGIVAGYASKSGKLGFIAAKPIPQVLRNINAFTLGAQSVNPKVTTTVVFTGDWSLPVKEADATNSLIDQGVDVLTMHVDSPKSIVQTAETRGVYSVGYHTSQAPLAPKGYLTGAEWNWTVVYENYLKALKSGGTWEHLVRGGLKDGFVKQSPFGPAVSDEAKAAVEKVKKEMLAGTFVIFKGPLKDNSGKEVVAAGTSQIQTDPALEAMGYLVAGVIGSTGS